MKYLHHYTTMDSLIKILEYGTIRFNNLANVNDKHEGDTFDSGNLGQYIFASCWTENSKENRLMWEKYGDSYKGVRISIPYPIFDLHYIDHFGPEPSLIPYDSLFDDGLFFLPTGIDKIIAKIDYTNDHLKLNPSISLPFGLNYGSLAVNKSKDWMGEEETRFLIYSIPFLSDNKLVIFEGAKFKRLLEQGINLMLKGTPNKRKYIDLKISKDLFHQMIITVGKNADDVFIKRYLESHWLKIETLNSCFDY